LKRRPCSMAVCAYLGLGVMGGPMARHLREKGHDVRVWNRTAAKAEAWAKANGGKAASLTDAVTGVEHIFMCLGDDPDVREVFGKIEPALSKGQTLVDHTTGSAGLARELAAACTKKGVGYLDGPVSGGQAGAEKGQLTVMCGGDEATFARV